MSKLAGKIALITGAAGGIGECIARQFVAEGAAVLIADILADEGEAVAASLRQTGARAIFQRTDVAVEAEVRAAVTRAVSEFGGLGILVNDAGWMRPEIATRVPEDEFDRTIDINLKGSWLAAKHVIPEMLKAGGGAIVNIASVYGRLGVPGRVAYGGAKAAVSSITRVLAVEYGPAGIRCNAVSPGAIVTDKLLAMHHGGTMTGEFERRVESFPLRRLGRVDDVAKAVLFLASDDAAWINGADLVVDGGLSVQSAEPLLFPPFRALWRQAASRA